MPDQLCLSLWVHAFDKSTMLRHLEELLGVFPFSKLRQGISGVRIFAVEFTEPQLVEVVFPAEPDIEQVMDVCRDFEHADCAYNVEGWWELWRYGEDWKLTPARVTLTCFGPQFEHEVDDHLRIELGDETDFLPNPDLPDSARKAQSNLASIVRLVRDIEAAMPIERRTLWSESGENFAERLDEAFDDEAD
jgi:hypothetical protein